MHERYIGSEAIIRTDKAVLMQLRDDIDKIIYPNHWCLFGGHGQEDEDPIDILIRELEEELSSSFAKEECLLWKSFDFKNDDMNAKIYVYTIRVGVGEISRFSLREGQGMAFIPFKDLYKYTITPPEKRFLEEYCETQL